MNLPVLRSLEDYQTLNERTGMNGARIATTFGTTMYPKAVREPKKTPVASTGLRVLKPAEDNNKLSGASKGKITKGPREFRDRPLFQLTLIERETCPSDCKQWNSCYGNHTPFGHRFIPGQALEDALEADLAFLNEKWPSGFVVRLHVLGDFYSVSYVAFWCRMLRKFDTLRLYGYTHYKYNTPIGTAVTHMSLGFPGRAVFMRSDKEDPNDPLPGAYTVPKDSIPNSAILVCPQQTGKTESCLTCGYCMHGDFEVQFIQHGRIVL